MPALRVKTADGWVEIKGAKGDPGLTPEEVQTAAEQAAAAAVDDAVATDPDIGVLKTGNQGDVIRGTISGVQRRRGDYVSPMDFGAAGDGSTDDYAAVMTALDTNIPVDLEGRSFYITQTMTRASGYVAIRGGVVGNISGATSGGTLKFPDGIDGIILEPGVQAGATIKDVTIKTNVATGPRAAGTGHGLTIACQSTTIDNVRVRGFGGNGVQALSGATAPGGTGNTNKALMTKVASHYNGGDGIFLDGDDSNVWTIIAADCLYNGGYGINNDGFLVNTFIGTHANANVQGDYRDNAHSSLWLNPYSEASGAFIVESGAIDGVLIMGEGGAPVLDAASLANANNGSWIVMRGGAMLTDTRMQSSDGNAWRWRMGTPGVGGVTFYSNALNQGWLSFNLSQGMRVGTLTTQKIGFYGKTPVVQPAANPDTSGATLTDLETEVNELKAVLRSLGLMAT